MIFVVGQRGKIMDDMISRQAAIDALKKHEIELPIYAPRETDVFWDDAIDCCVSEIEALPSAQPELNEWCPDCKEYDSKRHSCPRYNRVINEALKNARLKQKPGKWEIYIISMLNGEGYRCSECGSEGVPYWNFCPSCGADMRGEAE
jgi:hypothetical protein